MMVLVLVMSIPVRMDMEVIATGMVVEVEPGTRCGDRPRQERNG